MNTIYTFWSRHYNEVIVIVAINHTEAINKLKEVYMPGCDVDDWIIGSSMQCREGQSMSVHIIK